MIANLLTLTRPLIVPDCETTGTNRDSSRIIELAFEVHHPDGRVDEWRSLIDPGIPIPEAVTRIHGITDEMMRKCRRCGRDGSLHPMHQIPDGFPMPSNAPQMSSELAAMNDGCPAFVPIPTFAQIASKLAKGFSNCDFAGKNVRFNLQVLAVEFKRAGVEWSYAGASIVDVDRLEQLLNKRDLTTLYKKYTGKDLLDAHSALADVKATTEVIVGQLKVGELPHSLKALHELSWGDWIDTEGKFKRRDGVAIVNFGKRYNGIPMRDVPIDFWRDFILKNDFSDEVKILAREAMAGRFPA